MNNDKVQIGCRRARQLFALVDDGNVTGLSSRGAEQAGAQSAVRLHIKSCDRCERDYRAFALARTALKLSGASEPVVPDKEFFVALRARIARGPEQQTAMPQAIGDESWAAALMLTARQLIPAMAILLLIIIGATLAWDNAHPSSVIGRQPSERVLFNKMYDLPEPTPDDVLETLVAVEDRENGK